MHLRAVHTSPGGVVPGSVSLWPQLTKGNTHRLLYRHHQVGYIAKKEPSKEGRLFKFFICGGNLG